MHTDEETLKELNYQETKQRFEEYYQEQVIPKLQIIEKNRKRNLPIFVISTILVITWFAYSLFSFTMPDNTVKLGIWYNILGVILAFMAGFPIINYYRTSKESILPTLINFFGDFTYNYQISIDEKLLSESFLMPKYDQLKTDDSFMGIYENVPITLTEYNLYEMRIQQTKHTIRQYYAKTNSGLLLYAKMNKNFTGQTIVVKDLGIFNRFRRYNKIDTLNGKTFSLERVGIEDPNFEKIFEVYSDNQVEARYILTPSMIEQMMKLTKYFPLIQYSFNKEHVLLNIKTHRNMFECTSFFQSVINKKRIEKNFNELYELFAIINILRLNQKNIL